MLPLTSLNNFLNSLHVGSSFGSKIREQSIFPVISPRSSLVFHKSWIIDGFKGD